MDILRYLIIAAFGSCSLYASAWTIHADFDSGPIGAKVDKGSDGFSGAGGGGLYSDEKSIKGNSAKLHIKKGKTGYGMWGGEFMFPEKLYRGDTIWYQVHTYFPEDFDHYSYGEGNRLKFLRVCTRSAEDKNHGCVDFLLDKKSTDNAFKWIYEGENVWRNVGKPEDMIVKEKWESYQLQITFDSKPLDLGGQAEVRVWKNGELLGHITDRPTFKEDSDFSHRALLFTYWNGGAPKTQSMYVDEITITNERPDWTDAQGNPMIKSAVPQLHQD
ncbi:hypothetical protein [Marinobacter salicampi]|uniref:hypothetical protein n=1 Tax=Marinobacter salicampi TaxID=435907 RepID=UPI001408C30E|nr:hypothetical protein [Marinobacter salicampi]